MALRTTSMSVMMLPLMNVFVANLGEIVLLAGREIVWNHNAVPCGTKLILCRTDKTCTGPLPGNACRNPPKRGAGRVAAAVMDSSLEKEAQLAFDSGVFAGKTGKRRRLPSTKTIVGRCAKRKQIESKGRHTKRA